ncbi:hypothetical protein ANTPLA_LOCUS9979 [Anthophora plagiata]
MDIAGFTILGNKPLRGVQLDSQISCELVLEIFQINKLQSGYKLRKKYTRLSQQKKKQLKSSFLFTRKYLNKYWKTRFVQEKRSEFSSARSQKQHGTRHSKNDSLNGDLYKSVKL